MLVMTVLCQNRTPSLFVFEYLGNYDLLLDDYFDQPGRVARVPGKERKELDWRSLIYLQRQFDHPAIS